MIRPPFPGMDPYLEHPSLWPDVHNSLIAAIRDELSSQVAPHDYLLRSGEPMTVVGTPVTSDYRVLVSRGWQRPHAQLYTFDLRQPIPEIPVPLQKGEDEATLPLNEVLHALCNRARFDLRLDYTQPPVPPLPAAHTAWTEALVAAVDIL